MFRAFGIFLEGWATAATGAVGSGLEDMRRGVDLLREQNVLYFDGLLKIALAEAEIPRGRSRPRYRHPREALATCDRTGHRAFEAELHRTRGKILLKGDPANSAPAEEAFLTAMRSGGFGAPPTLTRPMGSVDEPTAVVDYRTSPQAALLYRQASRDYMPIHADPDIARTSFNARFCMD